MALSFDARYHARQLILTLTRNCWRWMLCEWALGDESWANPSVWATGQRTLSLSKWHYWFHVMTILAVAINGSVQMRPVTICKVEIRPLRSGYMQLLWPVRVTPWTEQHMCCISSYTVLLVETGWPREADVTAECVIDSRVCWCFLYRLNRTPILLCVVPAGSCPFNEKLRKYPQ